MDYQTAVSSGNSVGLETSQSAVSQAEVDQAEADYCEAMCQYGRNSAEVLVAHRYWMHLKTLRGRRLAAARAQHARNRTQAYHRRNGKSAR